MLQSKQDQSVLRVKPKLLKINEVLVSEELEAQQIAGDTLKKNRRLMENELVTVKRRNQRNYNKRFRHRRLRFGDSVLLWAPTGQNRPTSVWRGPTKLLEGLEMMSTGSRLVLVRQRLTMSTF